MSESRSSPYLLLTSKPPNRQETTSNPAATLAWIQTRLTSIYEIARADQQEDKLSTLDRASYLDIYTAIHDFCIATMSGQKGLNPGDFYRILDRIIREHCIEIRTRILESKDGGATLEQLTTTYLTRRNGFTRLVGFVTHLTQPLERVWIRRQIDEGRKDVRLNRDLHEMIWQQEVLGTDAKATGLEEMANAAEALHIQDGSESNSDEEPTKTFLNP
ncbi:hypothetical protein M436DRAFT_56060 [Aureobasidium namibiae CBS 147.97]|uniref:Cullin repeat-containing protein n=1 Tax=Aureobasidium namibiae CBS 147.97 TaxID=1043004 RepID=A0A074WHX3_9PEZI|nr:uncharacterized protein M436DRAFT_56060 [Aureobasidium namibiae CBS 147.97]KEQ69442.1 hypothetical protein M436DRAFT_56060 [Aureobasidium namibiae CBS 147.97]